MLSEAKIFFDHLVHFRQLLNEGVGENQIVDAIEKHKIVYIYYAGDDTIMKGYRTIKPMALGQTVAKFPKDGVGDYYLLRAWQEAGSTDSGKKYSDAKGRSKSGWRLFRVDKITSFLPTGKFFSTDENKMPEGYNPDDSQMKNIKAAVQVNRGVSKTQTKGIGDINEPNVIKHDIPQPSAFDGQKEKFQYFSKAGKKERDVTVDEIKHLWAIADKIKKKSRAKLLVVTDQNGDMVLKDISLQDKLPPESIVGNLKDLYLKYVLPTEKQDTSFINKVEDNIVKNMAEKKTLFK